MGAKRTKYHETCIYCGAVFERLGEYRHHYCGTRCRVAGHRAAAAGKCVSPQACAVYEYGQHSPYCTDYRARHANPIFVSPERS